MNTADKKTLSERKREAILQAARKAFKEFGVQATSMDKLAELAQVSKRTVYNHFATKEVLVSELLADLWQQSMVQPQVCYQADKPLSPQLAKLLMAEVALVSDQEYIDLARMAVGHFLFNADILQQQMARYSANETTLQRWLKAAVNDGQLNVNDTDAALAQLHSLIKGRCFWPQLLRIEPPLKEAQQQQLVDETMHMFFSCYGKKNPQ